MILDEYILCPYCNKKYSKYGIVRHISNSHGIKSHSYQDFTSNRYCPCGNKIYNGRKFCSLKCFGLYSPKNKKPYSLTPETLKNLILEYENNENFSLRDLSKKYHIPYDFLKGRFRKEKVKIRESRGRVIKQKMKKRLEDFVVSKVGRDIIKEYEEPGGNIRRISVKYNLNKKTVENILRTANVRIKTNKEAINEIMDIHKKLGIRHHRYGRKPPVGAGHCHWFLYKGVTYQGTWEFEFGLWLENKGLRFRCHKGIKIFIYETEGKKKTYSPDFYVEEWNEYIDVKGFFSKEDQEKIKIVRESYPEIKISIYDKRVLMEKGILGIHNKLSVHLEDFMIDHKQDSFILDSFIKRVKINDIVDQNILGKKSWGKIAKENEIHWTIISRFFGKFVPKKGSEEYYDFLINRYLDENRIKEDLKIRGIKLISQDLRSDIRFKTRYLLVKRIKERSICQ